MSKIDRIGQIRSKKDLLTVDVVDHEEELDLVVRRLSGELVHGVDELLQRDAAVVILVEDVKHPLDEEGLKLFCFFNRAIWASVLALLLSL